MANTVKTGIRTRKIAILAADGVDGGALSGIQKALKAAGAQAKIIAPRLGTLKTAQGHDVKIDWSFLTTGSVLFDAVFVPGGDKSLETLTAEPRAVEFVAEAYKHCKAIGATGEGRALLQSAGIGLKDRGVVLGKDADVSGVAGKFIQAVAQHRHWERERPE
jgi:catalase